MRKMQRTQRPWGTFDQFTHNEKTTVKILSVKPHEALSLQFHNKREEYWYVLSGDPTITVGDKTYKAKPGDEFEVQRKQVHRIVGGNEHAKILEIAFGIFDESDIIRLEDKYKRPQGI